MGSRAADRGRNLKPRGVSNKRFEARSEDESFWIEFAKMERSGLRVLVVVFVRYALLQMYPKELADARCSWPDMAEGALAQRRSLR